MMMSDSNNNVNNSTDNAASIQDKLVSDSLTANQRLNEQVQQGLQQNSQATNSSDTSTMSQSASQQFSSSQSLPESVPQGQQLTQPAIVTPKDNVANKSASGFDKTAIVNPHTAETDGEEDTHFGYRTVKKAEKQITIMPGGGLRSTNIEEINSFTNATYFHSSAMIDDSGIANLEEINRLKSLINSEK